MESILGKIENHLVFGWNERRAFYRHLSGQLKNGVAEEQAIEVFRPRLRRAGKKRADTVVGSIARLMRDGQPLSVALKRWAPDDERSVISGGEMSGNLSEALDRLIDTRRLVLRVRKSIRQAVSPPLTYLVAVYVVILVIGKLVVPGIAGVLPRQSATGSAAMLFVLGDLANSFWALLPPAVGLIIFIWWLWAKENWTGKYRIFAERHLFPFQFYRDTNGFIWLMNFVSLLVAGVADIEILKRQTINATPWLRERLGHLTLKLNNGESLGKALTVSNSRSGYLGFPNPDIADAISSMAEFSDFPEKISVLANDWAKEIEEESVAWASRFGFWMEMLMYSVMGLLMLAMTDLSTQLGSVGVR